MAHTTSPFAIIPLSKQILEKHVGWAFESGSNDFTTTRFLVPWLMDFQGPALFVDGADMVANEDLADIFKFYDPMSAVKVVKHKYQTKHPRKYVGSKMESDNEDYDRKQWASVMLFSCGHPEWRKYTPEFVASQKKIDLLQFKGITRIEELPIEWNWMADELGPNDKAKIVHWTAGVPGFEYYRNTPMAKDFLAYHTKMMHLTD